MKSCTKWCTKNCTGTVSVWLDHFGNSLFLTGSKIQAELLNFSKFKAIFFWNKVKLKSKHYFNEEVGMSKCNNRVCMHRHQCKWKMKTDGRVGLKVTRKLSVLSYSATMSRCSQNAQLSGTDYIPKASDKPTFEDHTSVLCLNTHTLPI